MSHPRAYRVLSPLRHNGVEYRPELQGLVTPSAKAAQRLLALGVIAPAPENPPPGEAVPGTTQDAEIALADAGSEKPRGGDEAAPGKTNINTASAEELAEAMHGVGIEIAARIVASRETAGPFASVDALRRVAGVGPATIARHRERLEV